MCMREAGRQGQDQTHQPSGRCPNQSEHPGTVSAEKRPTLATDISEAIRSTLVPPGPLQGFHKHISHTRNEPGAAYTLVIEPSTNFVSLELTSSVVSCLPVTRASGKLASGFTPLTA